MQFGDSWGNHEYTDSVLNATFRPCLSLGVQAHLNSLSAGNPGTCVALLLKILMYLRQFLLMRFLES
jgi:hypothetical protein